MMHVADAGHHSSIGMEEMSGGLGSRVWYAEILLLFSIFIPDDNATYELAWVRWYECYGQDSTGNQQHKDPRFPPALNRVFPRIYLPDHGESDIIKRKDFDVIEISSCLAPAPICDDVSVTRLNYDGIQDPRQLAQAKKKKHLEISHFPCKTEDMCTCSNNNCTK